MKDVAREAGVSLGTVSNVLNGLQTVQPKNYEKVMSAVEKLGFRSNMTARALRTRMSENIGLILPSINNPYYHELARGVEDAANDLGLTVFLCNGDRNLQKERKYIDALVSKGVDGLILIKPQIGLEEADTLCNRIRVVLVDVEVPPSSRFSVVKMNDALGVQQALDLLWSYGHKKIAFISGLLESDSSRTRYNTYLSFLRNQKLPKEKSYIAIGNYTWNSGYLITNEFLSLPNPPTAIFAANDIMAIGSIKAIHERGLRIPEDISVVGFDNIDMAELCYPGLTTVNQPKYEIGKISVSMLDRYLREDINGGHVPPQVVTLEPTIIHRASAGPAPGTT